MATGDAIQKMSLLYKSYTYQTLRAPKRVASKVVCERQAAPCQVLHQTSVAAVLQACILWQRLHTEFFFCCCVRFASATVTEYSGLQLSLAFRSFSATFLMVGI